MLKKIISITLFFFISLCLFSQINTAQKLREYEAIIVNRSQRLEALFNGVNVNTDYLAATIKIKYNDVIIRQLNLQKEELATAAENIISFFLSSEESLLLIKTLKKKDLTQPLKIEVIEALYEYPLIDDYEKKLIYISNKGTGNRNPFILNLQSGQEEEVIIPDTGDYFPIFRKDRLFFLMAVEDGFSLISYDVTNKSLREIAKGKINCLRHDPNYLYYAEENTIYKLDQHEQVIESYSFNNLIQSFDIFNGIFVISMLNGLQYDLYLYHIKEEKLNRLTDTEFNELDVLFQDENSIIFSSNKQGTYDLYHQNYNEVTHSSDYKLIYANDKGDIFYPCYSKYYSKIICSIYETNKEPKILIIPY